jgi:anaerobic magnesium-protoporphyrin IX monomethyl ester cyclase
MKVLLVQSPTGRREEPIFPIGLAFLAGQLLDFDVRAMDLSLHEKPVEALASEIRLFEPAAIAISLRNIDDSTWPRTHSYLEAFGTVMEALGNWKGVLIAGGPGFTIYPEVLLRRFPRIDFGVVGEGERALPALLGAIGTGNLPEPLLRPERPDLEKLAPPRYDILDLAPYARGFGVGVQSRRGCAFSCSYCTYPHISGSTFRCRPAASVMGDIERLRSLGVRRFQFVDSVFDVPRPYFLELLGALRSLPGGLEWGAWLGTDVDREDLHAMRAAGAAKVDFSPDAITRRGLSLLGKAPSPSKLYSVVREARQAGMAVGVSFFNGNPGEGFAALLAKIAFMLRVRLGLGWRKTFVSIGTIRVYANSEIACEMKGSGAVPSEWDFLDPVFVEPRGPSRWLYRLYSSARECRHGG